MKRTVVCLALLALTSLASANTLMIGNNNNGNCLELACGASLGFAEFQQHYAASAFGTGPINIDSFSYFAVSLLYWITFRYRHV